MANPQPRSHSACPFIAGPRIEDPARFVGRRDELRLLASRMTGAQPTSVNVVGDRRIGKSSLLYHFCQTYGERVNDRDRYAVVYLDLQSEDCTTEAKFYRATMAALRSHRLARARPELAQLVSPAVLDRDSFATAIRAWEQRGVLPVICLDRFERLLKHLQEFNDGFYNRLRALMDGSDLMLIVASRRNLDDYAKEYGLTSPFFNVGQRLEIEELEPEAVTQLVRVSDEQGQPSLHAREQALAKAWGGRHPFLLQLAALKLWDATQMGKDEAWAKREFDREVSRVKSRRVGLRRWQRRLRWLLVVPLVGQVVRWIGGVQDDVGNAVAGVLALAAVAVGIVFVVTKPASFPEVMEQVKAWVTGTAEE
ncbi:MAG: AAA-like domain-containing protein [Elainellaceae cyanobacterium]